jgi:nicotinate-nucleotide pyrophosphorylase (carboxylating)
MIAHTKARLTCTRKTLPGLRAIEKYAVHVGGGSNHRFGLHDAVLIKDNHIAAVGGLSAVIARTREYQKLHMLRLAIEVESCEQFCLVKDSHLFDHVLLDNMCCDEMKDSVASNDGVLTLEATGGVCIDNIIAIADTGVDYISAGFLTHSASYLDLGLDVE